MEFHETLQKLRTQKGLTQEELATALYVSRAAVSKWESGRGYPNIDSLKAIARFFSVTVDGLLSGEELLTLAEQENRREQSHIRDLILGLLDIGTVMLLFLPFFAQKAEGVIREVSLLALDPVSPYLKILYFVSVFACVVFGILLLALQNCRLPFWNQIKNKLSPALSASGALLFTLSLQPYAAAFLWIFSIIQVCILLKKQ